MEVTQHPIPLPLSLDASSWLMDVLMIASEKDWASPRRRQNYIRLNDYSRGYKQGGDESTMPRALRLGVRARCAVHPLSRGRRGTRMMMMRISGGCHHHGAEMCPEPSGRGNSSPPARLSALSVSARAPRRSTVGRMGRNELCWTVAVKSAAPQEGRTRKGRAPARVRRLGTTPFTLPSTASPVGMS